MLYEDKNGLHCCIITPRHISERFLHVHADDHLARRFKSAQDHQLPFYICSYYPGIPSDPNQKKFSYDEWENAALAGNPLGGVKLTHDPDTDPIDYNKDGIWQYVVFPINELAKLQSGSRPMQQSLREHYLFMCSVTRLPIDKIKLKSLDNTRIVLPYIPELVWTEVVN